MGTQQPSLFEWGEDVGFRPLEVDLEHVELGEGAWLDVRRRWMSRPELLFERLVTSVPWRSERRRMYDRTVDVPRLLAFYDEGDQLPDPSLNEAREILTSMQ